MLLRNYLEQGLPKTVIAEQLGISRRTIYHWIETGQLDRDIEPGVVRYRPRPPVPTKLTPYEEIIRTRLEAFPKLTAVRLLQEVRAAGYTGGYTQLKEFVRKVRPRPEAEPVVRFETPPGKQAQVDFARFRFSWGIRWALLVVLGYSRRLWFQFYRRQDMGTLFRGLEEAFAHFGGVPGELLFDQMKNVVTDDLRPDGGRLLENAEFVERPIRYVREGFVYGRSFAGDADLNAQALRGLETVANVRIHHTTHERPADRFEPDERSVLGALAPRPYRSLVVPLATPTSTHRERPAVPRILVERRPLSAYAQIAGGEA